MGKFIISKTMSGEYRFRLKATNGEIILVSESYTSKSGCMNGIEAVKFNAQKEERYERKSNARGHFFYLKASNGQIIGISEIYTTSAGRENGIISVKNNSINASIEDLAS